MKQEYSTLTLLGSTGSIGRQALLLAETKNIKITGLCAGKNVTETEAQARRFLPKYCALADESAANDLKVRLADTETVVLSGADGICELISHSDGTVLNAIIGSAGLRPTLAVLEAGLPLALANKESLVMAGRFVTELAKARNVLIRPVDSEHSAIWQCLSAGKHSEIKKLILTASGGPFFGLKRQELEQKTLADALSHPTWKMGKAITVDSATLMNKGFEVIEAAYLFGIPADRIKVLVHRESIIHSMVEYIDNSVMAQLSLPDMCMCINLALTYPDRFPGVTPELDLAAIGKLSFFEPDMETFSLLSIAYTAFKAGGALPAVLHSANETAVNAFINGKLKRFTDIQDIVCRVTDELSYYSGRTGLSDVYDADSAARERTLSLI